MIKFVRFIISNLFTLLLSSILAFLIWVNASQTEDPIQDRWLQIPLEYVGQPEDSVLLSAQRQSVQIFFEGPSSIVSQLSANDFSAIVDLSQVPFGEEVPVTIQVQAKNDAVNVLSQPEPVSTLLEQLVTVEIPVELDIRGEVARGHVLGDALIDPQFITVSGPASRAEILDRARATVFLNNDRESIIEQTQPIFYDRQGRVASVNGLNLSHDQLQVTIPINEAENYAEKFISPDLVGEPAPGYRLLSATIEPPSVLIQGRPTQINAITQVRTEPVDLTGLTESFRQQVSLELPDGITLDEVVEVFVDIEIEPFLTTRPYNQSVVVQGLAEDLDADIEPENVRVVLFGPLPVLETLVDEEVRVTVDLFGLEAGIYSLDPVVNFPDRGIELRSVQPSLVTVNITRLITITNELTATIPLTDTTSSLGRPGVPYGVGTVSHDSLLVIQDQPSLLPVHLPRRENS
jgi:YbbR domain-containing protein